MKSGARTEVEQGHTAFVQNFDINLGRATFGEILMKKWGTYFRAEFLG
jgi:hypothetical protein